MNYFVMTFKYFTKILVPFPANPIAVNIFFVFFAALLFIGFMRSKKLLWLKLFLFAYLLLVSAKLIVSGLKDNQNSVIVSELSEYRSYASRICLSCIGIE
ncbi:hypothetical protein JXL83_08170 [candidate division WOR-3 bacterium]|nr:hypothetical protein [candidate division WOR-3 bacterium]